MVVVGGPQKDTQEDVKTGGRGGVFLFCLFSAD